MKNLTDPLEIRHALERKLGNGAVTIFAKKHNYSLPYMSQTISGERSAEHVLRLMANCLGCRVHGVFPDKKNKKPRKYISR